MHLDDQPVGAGGDRGECQRRHERRVAAGMARIDDHREMRLALEHRNRRDVERVARRRLVGANPALAQHDVVIPVRHDVLGRHQQFFNRRRQAALEQHGSPHATELGEQREVLHVARADLQHVGVLGDQVDLARVHHFRDDRQAGRRARTSASMLERFDVRAPGTRTATCAA